MGARATKLISAVESIRDKYLVQLMQGKYTRIEFDNKFSHKPLIVFERMKYNINEEVDKFIVCQWLMSQDDWRFENYVPYILIPAEPEDIGALNLQEILKLVTPHNIINS